MGGKLWWFVYFPVLLVLLGRAKYLEFKLLQYIRKRYPKLTIAYQWSKGEWHPWSIFSRRMRRLIKEDDIGDPELIRLAIKGRKASRWVLLWFSITPVIIMVIYFIFL